MKTLSEQIEQFKQETGYTLEVRDGKPYYGGWLDLSGTQITSLPENLTVGGDLYLDGTQITSLPENLTVGGWLDLSGTGITDTSKVNRHAPDIYTWRNNKYIKCDGVFSRVLSHKGNVWKVQSIGKEDTMYIVTDGNGRYAHGETIKAAKADLIYKISNRDKSKYESLTLDSTVTFEEAIEMYRVITGACAAGTKNFVENRLREKKAKYTIAEIIELTKGEYQADVFAEFFKH